MPHTHSLSPSLKVRLSSFSLFIFYHSSFVFHLSSFYTVIILYLHTSSLSLTLPLTNPLLFLSLFYFFAPDVVKLSSSHFSFSLLLSYFIPTSPFSSSFLSLLHPPISCFLSFPPSFSLIYSVCLIRSSINLVVWFTLFFTCLYIYFLSYFLPSFLPYIFPYKFDQNR